MSREARLLDALEDAQENYDRHRRQLAFGMWLLFGSIVAILGTAAGMFYLHTLGVDLGMLGAIFILYALTLPAGGAVVGHTWFEELPKSRGALKKAQRDHRDYLTTD